MKRVGQPEVEVKLIVRDRRAMTRLLRGIGARRVRRVHERNVLFDTHDGRLRQAGKLLRLRWNDGDAVLTFKSPTQGVGGERATKPPRYKVRREIEFPVADADRLMAVLEGLGYMTGFRYEKHRTSYRLSSIKGLHIELDETPIGDFLELEGPRRSIDRVARKLGFTASDYITANYRALYSAYCRREGQKFSHMLFRNRKVKEHR